MKEFIKQNDSKRNIKTPDKETFSAMLDAKKGTTEDYEQTSNMPMAVLILLCMLNGAHNPDVKEATAKQEIVTIDTMLYKSKETKKKNEKGEFYSGRGLGVLLRDPPKSERDLKDYWKTYEESLHLRFNPPTPKKGTHFLYSLEDVIWGWLYADPIPDDQTIYTVFKNGKPPWRLTNKQRETLDKFVEDNFDFRYDFYHVLQHGDRTAPTEPVPKTKKEKIKKEKDEVEDDSEVEGESEEESPCSLELMQLGIKGGLNRFNVERVPQYKSDVRFPKISKTNKGIDPSYFDNLMAHKTWQLNNLFLQKAAFLRTRREMGDVVPFVASASDVRATYNFKTEP
jgi:hypothetical protein